MAFDESVQFDNIAKDMTYSEVYARHPNNGVLVRHVIADLFLRDNSYFEALKEPLLRKNQTSWERKCDINDITRKHDTHKRLDKLCGAERAPVVRAVYAHLRRHGLVFDKLRWVGLKLEHKVPAESS